MTKRRDRLRKQKNLAQKALEQGGICPRHNIAYIIDPDQGYWRCPTPHCTNKITETEITHAILSELVREWYVQTGDGTEENQAATAPIPDTGASESSSAGR